MRRSLPCISGGLHLAAPVVMDHVSAQDIISEARQLAMRKASLSTGQMLLRGALAGGILAYATSLAMVIVSQGVVPIVAALCFPVGFVMLVLLGLELATGNFALMPAAAHASPSSDDSRPARAVISPYRSSPSSFSAARPAAVASGLPASVPA